MDIKESKTGRQDCMNNKRNVKYVADLIDRDAIAGPSVHLNGVQVVA